MAVQLAIPLSEVDASNVATAGGKGSSLGELMRAGAPVPPGFVVTSAAFAAFIDGGDHRRFVVDLVRQLDAGEIKLEAASDLIKAHLHDVPVPDEVAAAITATAERHPANRVSVRSSATCEDSGASAWAGQLDTYLDVAPADIVDRVRDCWLSIFSQPALAYGAAHGYGAGEFAVAVVVQQMVASDVSGIGFSVHPVTQEPHIELIEACYGLGEAIVSGRISPDQYIVDRQSGEITERLIGAQREGLFMQPGEAAATWRDLGTHGETAKLTDEQVTEYAKMLARIDDHYGHPVDTEWALEAGEFRVLQARPITTLADEYRETLFDPTDEWTQIVRRPMTLLQSSVVTHWIDSRHAERSIGFHVDRAMVIQDEAGLAHLLFPRRMLEACAQRVKDLYKNDRPELMRILHRGQEIYDQSTAQIQQGADAFANIDEAVDFFADVAQHTTVFPSMTLRVYEAEGYDDGEVRQLAEQLRSHTLYPTVEREIIDQLATRAASAAGFAEPDEAVNLVTWSDLRRGPLDRELLQSRLEEIRNGRRFIFQSIDGDDRLRFVSQTGYLLMRIARERRIENPGDENQLSGQAAWPGVCRARARVVLSRDTRGQTIEEGEVLVSIQSSPELMPLLEHCGAIVTDEGGIACHAAIISRELRKPTLIGTGLATSMIHTGDLVEVDTYAQTVRVIERAGE